MDTLNAKNGDQGPTKYSPLFPIPNEMGNLAFFSLMDDPALRTAVDLRFAPEKAHHLALWLTSYPAVVAYFGQSRTVERLCEEHIGLYGNLSTSWKESLKASALIHHAIFSAASDYLFRYTTWCADSYPGDLALPVSVMIGWMLHEGATFFLKDYVPLFSHASSALIDDLPAVVEAAQVVQEHLSPLADGFSEAENPYRHIADVHSSLQLNQEAEEWFLRSGLSSPSPGQSRLG
ncbi:hypothetical protein [Methylacidimicrobium sp. B4]|uniref:hypothetical protein n=1 Tax=Methylacidimicrobium sp. B4 TaxID=2796139 RepID=UPI001A8D64F8|nr:hypothetical protein [Methylacidimicrobium sp. B4]QSR85022.1 hypothetical protein MacB4_01770 [Methylacidimicrobium sp. B4]